MRDGETFEIDGETFEFDLGYTLVTRAAAALTDGETLTIVDADTNTFTFEIDLNGVVDAADLPVSIMPNDSADVVADAIVTVLQDAGLTVTPHQVGNRINLEGAQDVQLAGGGLALEGAPGTEGIAVVVHAGMSSDEVAEAMVQPLADTFANGLTDVIKFTGNLVRVIGHRVGDPGPLGLTSTLPGDALGNFNTPLRAKNTPENSGRNDDRLYAFADDQFNFAVPFEGVYVDDLIIGFAAFGERGADLRPDYPHEPVQGFETIPDVFEGEIGGLAQIFPPPGSILTGEYQVEIRRAADFADGVIPTRTFDPRFRLSQNVSLTIPSGGDAYDGLTVFVSDGVRSATFEFEDEDVGNGVANGNLAVPFVATDPAYVLVERLRDLINGLYLTKQLSVTAAGSNGAAVGSVGTSDRLDLFGTAVSVGGDLEPTVFDESGPKIDSVTRGRS